MLLSGKCLFYRWIFLRVSKDPCCQGLKAVFKLNRYLYNFTNKTPKHRIELLDKLVTQILNYGSEVWKFCQAKPIESTHMMFCKHLLA